MLLIGLWALPGTTSRGDFLINSLEVSECLYIREMSCRSSVAELLHEVK